jgi:hypothetical protein
MVRRKDTTLLSSTMDTTPLPITQRARLLQSNGNKTAILPGTRPCGPLLRRRSAVPRAGTCRGAARFSESQRRQQPFRGREGDDAAFLQRGRNQRSQSALTVRTGRLPPNAPYAPQFPRPFWPCRCSGGVFHWPSWRLMKGGTGTRIMPDEAPPTIEPTREPICEKCGGALEQLSRLPKFDHPTFDIFRCLACGVVSWIAQEDE